MIKTNKAVHRTIQVDKRDNVAIVVDPGGLKAGALLENGIRLVDDVPQGHKVALGPLAAGAPIIRYGEIIGTAATDIVRGQWIHEALVSLPEPPRLADIPLTSRPVPPLEPLEGYSFEGYRNPDGSVGTRNILGISTSVQCVAGVGNVVLGRIKQELLPKYPHVDDVVVLHHGYGCGVAINAPAAMRSPG